MKKAFVLLLQILIFIECVMGGACVNGGETSIFHVHNFNQKKIEQEYIKTQATCLSSASYYYSCECGEKGTKTFDFGQVKEHDYTSKKTNPTCIDRGYTTYTCSCGHSYIGDYLDATGIHDYVDGVCVNCFSNLLQLAIESVDMSKNADQSVKGYIIKSGESEYDLYVIGQGQMKEYTSMNSPIKQSEYKDKIKNVYIENGVTSVGKYSFDGITSIQKLIISDSVKSIGKEAFKGCSSLEYINLGKGITSVGNQAFFDTEYYLDSSRWENGVLYIGNYLIMTKSSIVGSYGVKDGTTLIADFAFESCQNLLEIVFPNSLKYIGQYAFANAINLSTVVYNGSEQEWESIEKGSAWNYNVANDLIVNYKGV